MAGGEVCYSVFNQAAERLIPPDKPEVPALNKCGCCFLLTALATFENDEDLQNDKHTILGKYNKYFYTDVKIWIQKEEGGIYVDKQLADASTGDYLAFGVVEDLDDSYVAYTVNWRAILIIYGIGKYRFRFEETIYTGSTTENLYPFEFCLKEYTPRKANGTVRFTWYQKGVLGNWVLDEDVLNYNTLEDFWKAEGFYNQIRLPSIIGQNKSNYQREYIRYQNGELRYLQDEQVESYIWSSGYFPALLHQFIKTEIIQADKIYATDYNTINPNIIVNKQINPNSGYEPIWHVYKQESKVEVEFVQAIQYRRKRRC